MNDKDIEFLKIIFASFRKDLYNNFDTKNLNTVNSLNLNSINLEQNILNLIKKDLNLQNDNSDSIQR